MVRFHQLTLLVSLSLCTACAPAPSTDSAAPATPAPSAPAEPAADSNSTSATRAATETLYTQAEAKEADEASGVNSIGEENPEGEPTLNIGDKAPAVSIANWIHGAEVEKFKKDGVYVVEFWATWCPPCRASMPHLSKLQQEYGDRVKFIGVTDEDADTVKTFLESKQSEEEEKTWNEVVTYALALDKDKETGSAYMQAAQQNGIPTAFIVGKQGLIEWIGHPMEIDLPLQQVLDGNWDRKAYAKVMEQKRESEKVMMKLQMAVQGQKWDDALAAVETLAASDPENPQWPFARARILLMAERFKDANGALAKVSKANWENHQLLNFVAWTMLNDIPEADRDAKEALAIAERANELTQGKDGSVLDTLARAHYAQGDLKKAIEIQEKAVEIGSPGNDEALKESLEKYKAELEESKDKKEKK